MDDLAVLLAFWWPFAVAGDPVAAVICCRVLHLQAVAHGLEEVA